MRTSAQIHPPTFSRPLKLKRRFMLRMHDRTPVKDVSGDPLYFATKTAAKAYRSSTSESMVVSPGPDHRNW